MRVLVNIFCYILVVFLEFIIYTYYMLGERIKKLRKEQNLTQSAVAAAVGVSREALSLWENGLRIPNADSLMKLCGVFGVSPNYLITGGECGDWSNGCGSITSTEARVILAGIDAIKKCDKNLADQLIHNIDQLGTIYHGEDTFD
jgi:transcriptional regulator with XRE-family HTH domain